MEDIFLISLAGTPYGIRKEDVASIRTLDALHRIPLSPAGIAGIMVDGDHTVMLGHLAKCVGVRSPREIEEGCILLRKDDARTGFVVNGPLRTQPIPPEMIFRLPDCLQTPAFDACAIHDDIPIPLINIGALRGLELPPEKHETRFSPTVSAPRPQDVSRTEEFRFFSIGGELFATPSSGLETRAVKPGAITPLPGMPHHVKGVTFHQGRLLPVIDLSQRIVRRSSAQGCLMLVTGSGDTAFGLLVDSDAGTMSRQETRIVPVPFIAQTAWMKHAVAHAGQPIPMIDLGMALCQEPADDREPACQYFAPDSVFPETFFEHEVEVVEFSLLGERCALPKIEVEDIIPFMPCRALPDAPHIVSGVVEHDGEILPVLDLATMFGRHSLPTPAWRMMRVKNGNFRALVLTDAVCETKCLPPEMHRSVPLNLPHGLMYGCYPDGKAARLLLNVAAIAVYFEKSLTRQFLPALSHEMKIPEAGATCTLPSEDDHCTVENETFNPGAGPISEAGAKPAHETTLPQDPVRATQSGPAEPVRAAMKGRHSTRRESELGTPLETETVTMVAPQPIGAAQSGIVPEGHDGQAAGTAARRQAQGAEFLLPAHTPSPAGTADRAWEEEQTSTGVSAHNLNTAPSHVSQEAGPNSFAPHPGEPQPGSELTPYDNEAAWLPLRRHRMAYAAIGAAPVALLFYFSGNLISGASHTHRLDATPGTLSAVTAQHAVLPISDEIKVKNQATRTTTDSGPALELIIPRHMARIDLDEYVVAQGDTLWSISLRFTGSPFNYPRIAGQNRIADPDLIFPGQRIKFIK